MSTKVSTQPNNIPRIIMAKESQSPLTWEIDLGKDKYSLRPPIHQYIDGSVCVYQLGRGLVGMLNWKGNCAFVRVV
jgi:hypothetical protein